MRNKKNRSEYNNAGFTLVEMVIALAISTFVVTAIYSAYQSQRNAYRAQDQVAMMQQNLRAAMLIMGADIKMAGYAPFFNEVEKQKFRVQSANEDTFVFTVDLNDSGGDPELGETFTYEIYTPAAPAEQISRLRRFADQPGSDDDEDGVANHIEAIEFLYLDTDNTVLASPVSAADIPKIRAVTVSLLARASKPDREYTNNKVYKAASKTWDLNGTATGDAANDNYRRRVLISTINCRNLGL